MKRTTSFTEPLNHNCCNQEQKALLEMYATAPEISVSETQTT